MYQVIWKCRNCLAHGTKEILLKDIWIRLLPGDRMETFACTKCREFSVHVYSKDII